MRKAVLWILVVLGLAASAGAQSLADIAKKEEARRKEIKTPSKVYTNEDLKRYAPSTPSAPTPPTASGQASTTAPGTGTPQAAQAQPPADKEPAKDEKWWRGRLTEQRDRLERNTLLVDSLQTRANALLNDFFARDDPAQRQVLSDEREKTLAELQRVKDEITAATTAIADIEEEARRANVPPGWLRQ